MAAHPARVSAPTLVRVRGETQPRRLVAVAILAFSLLAPAALGGQARPQPSRIVSLVPALTEMIFAIGAGDRVVAVSSYDDDPPEVRNSRLRVENRLALPIADGRLR